MHIVRIGSRGSELALWQAHHVRDLLEAQGSATELIIIKTQGDRVVDVPFSQMPGKGFFTKELEEAQLEGRIDLAVHSMKDMTTDAPPGLTIGAMVGREDARDVLLAHPAAIDEGRPLPLRAGSKVGTSSARRQAQAWHAAPDIELADLRGNVPTRVGKLREGRYDAIILALAGVKRLRLDLSDLAVVPLDPSRFVPAPAQGMLAIQCRDEPWLRELLARIHSVGPTRAVSAERWLLERLDGGCHLPFGCYVHETARGYALDLFLEVRPQPPLTLHLEGGSPQRLAEAAWEVARPYRASAS